MFIFSIKIVFCLTLFIFILLFLSLPNFFPTLLLSFTHFPTGAFSFFRSIACTFSLFFKFFKLLLWHFVFALPIFLYLYSFFLYCLIFFSLFFLFHVFYLIEFPRLFSPFLKKNKQDNAYSPAHKHIQQQPSP